MPWPWTWKPPAAARLIAATGLAALAAVALFAAVALPLLDVLSLDLRALLATIRQNLYEGPNLRDDHAALIVAVLRYGALPLLFLGATAFVLRVRARFVPGAFTLDRAPGAVRAALAAAALVPFAAFAAPCSIALSVWAVVEAIPWVQWYGVVDDLPERIISIAAPALFAAVLLAGAGATRAALRRRPRPGEPARRGLARRVALAAVIAPVALAAAVPGLAIAVHATRVVPVLGKATAFERHCSGCHVPEAPLVYTKTPEEWRHQLETTCFDRPEATPENKAWIGVGTRGVSRHYRRYEFDAEAREEVLEFLYGMRSFSDQWTFRTRCQRCHVLSYLAFEDRHPDDWALVVERVSRYSPLYYDASVRRQVVRHLASEFSDVEEAPGGLDAVEYRRVLAAQKACGSCHFLSRKAEASRAMSNDETMALVRRMSEHMPRPLGEDELLEVAAGYRILVADPERMKKLAPHDRPVFEGGLPW